MNSPNPSPSHGFTSPSTQSSLHQIAISLPALAPRKQNVACDACRSRKVKCVRNPGHDKCQHCHLKNCPCTHFVQQATNVKRRGAQPYHKKRSHSSTVQDNDSVLMPPPPPSNGSSLSFSDLTTTSPPFGILVEPTPHFPSLAPTNGQTTTLRLIKYLLNPQEHKRAHGDYQPRVHNPDLDHAVFMRDDFADIRRKLENDTFCVEFALDLVEVYFQICHTRLPLLDPSQFRQNFQSSLPQSLLSAVSLSLPSVPLATDSTPQKPVHPALLATVLAWGAKFSEHPVLVLDRERGDGRSRIARMLLSRAREVAEAEKIHRLPTADHVIIALLLEPLQSQNPSDGDGFHNFWVSCAIRHLFDLGINHRSTTENILDSDTRGKLKLAWWMACLHDAYGAVFFRRKPTIEDEDYDIELLDSPTETASEGQHQGVPASAQSQFFGWYAAAHGMARVVREMSRQLWRPGTEAEGVSFDQINRLAEALYNWRDEYLVRVGVPSNFQADWDFVAAVSACSSDAQYHVMWIILFNAVEEFGIREMNETQNNDVSMHTIPNIADIEALRLKVAEEAIHGAVRIAGLAGVLTSNGYLRLDPNVLHFAVFTAGMLLARQGKEEVRSCIAGLKQYGYAYEEAFGQADEMERVFNQHVSNTGTSPQEHYLVPFMDPISKPFTPAYSITAQDASPVNSINSTHIIEA